MTFPLQTDNLTEPGSPGLNGSSPLPVPPLSGTTSLLPSPGRRGPSRRWLILVGGVVLAGAIVGTAMLVVAGTRTDRADLLFHTVKLENLDLTIVERGTLESADNRDIICRVKANKGGTYATTIKWVIDDGTLVRAGQTTVILDSSALEDQFLAQKITVAQALAKKVSAEENYKIVESKNFSEEEKARTTIQLKEQALEKYVGLPNGTLSRLPRPQAQQTIDDVEAGLESFLAQHAGTAPASQAASGSAGGLVARWQRYASLKGEFQGALDELTGKVDLARADLETYRDRFAYSQRMEQKRYVSPSQVQADESRMNSAREAFKKAESDRNLLRTFTGRMMVKDYSSQVEEAWRAYDVAKRQSRATEAQAAADRDTQRSVYEQELLKIDEIEKQIQECKVVAPQDGMVVYFVSEQSRYGSGSQQSIIAQGEPVREGQKLMRIPDLRRMQVTTRIHEAMISRVRGDDRRSTGFSDALRAAMLTTPDALGRLLGQQEAVQEEMRSHFRDKEYYLSAPGQKALVRVEAFSDKPLRGHVKTVATVPAQQDWSSPDVKVYQTVVSVDDQLYGLKPGLSAEVTILVENTGEKVPAIPVQAIVGGAEFGPKRKVWVKTEAGPVERDVVIGLSNDKMAEVKPKEIIDGKVVGLDEGEQVVINPKVLLGDKAKTREPGEGKEQQFKKGGWGEGGKGNWGGGGTKGGGIKGGGMKGGGYPGGQKGGPPQGGAPSGEAPSGGGQ